MISFCRGERVPMFDEFQIIRMDEDNSLDFSSCLSFTKPEEFLYTNSVMKERIEENKSYLTLVDRSTIRYANKSLPLVYAHSFPA